MSEECDEEDDVQEESEDEIIASSSKRQDETVEAVPDHDLNETTIHETVSEDQAFKTSKGKNLLQSCMQALSIMHNLDPETCYKIRQDRDSIDESESRNITQPRRGTDLNIDDLQTHLLRSDKFVRHRGQNSFTRKNAQLQKIIQQTNGSIFEFGGREVRCMDLNPRWNYNQQKNEGEYDPSFLEQQMLAMQPAQYTIYNRNLAQTVSRNLAGVDEVITGLDTSWAGGRHALQNYLEQRYTIPKVRQQLCQSLASKQES